MNIFRLHDDPYLCASYHNDKHVVKMILESCQLLSTAHRVNDGEEYIVRKAQLPRISSFSWVQANESVSTMNVKIRETKKWRLDRIVLDQQLYQATHINHPCAIWCRESQTNYVWLWYLTAYLSAEYTRRYGKIHKCEWSGLIRLLRTPPTHFPKKGPTEPPQAMPESCKVIGDPVEAYRNYYRKEKRHIANWKGSEVPSWFF